MAIGCSYYSSSRSVTEGTVNPKERKQQGSPLHRLCTKTRILQVPRRLGHQEEVNKEGRKAGTESACLSCFPAFLIFFFASCHVRVFVQSPATPYSKSQDRRPYKMFPWPLAVTVRFRG